MKRVLGTDKNFYIMFGLGLRYILTEISLVEGYVIPYLEELLDLSDLNMCSIATLVYNIQYILYIFYNRDLPADEETILAQQMLIEANSISSSSQIQNQNQIQIQIQNLNLAGA